MTPDLPVVPPAAAWHACAQEPDDRLRLACYDALIRPRRPADPASLPDAPPTTTDAVPVATPTVQPALPTPPLAATSPANNLARYWELDDANRRSTFRFIGYRPNYFLPVQVSSRINRLPTSPNPNNAVAAPLAEYRSAESKVQLSIRTKFAQGVLLPGDALWFTYTQQSFWQLYSPSLSAPFRATDHEPELLYVVPMPAELPAGWRMRMGGLGLVHQSNGQALPLSRSWNRLVGLAGLERGELAFVARLNQRLSEDALTNDNPDLVSFRGRWDLTALWTPGLATTSLNWRTNLDRRGSLQVDWTFPVDTTQPGGLRWYAQAFAGYGESLLDYNVRKASVGFGVTLFGW